MRRPTAIILALASLVALVLATLTATSRAQDGQRTVNLTSGCNMVTLTFATGTDASALTTAVSPPEALDTVWRLDNATRTFQAFMPQAPQASDLTSLNLLDAAFICMNTAAIIAMPTVASDPAGSPISVNLSTGCNAVGLSFAEGSAPADVASAMTPAGALQSIWRLDNVTHAFQAYVAAAPQASDLTSLAFLDAVFICTGGPATLSIPAVTEPAATVAPPPTPGGTGEEAVRYVMEAAVPQVVDLPQGFVAIDEYFWTSGEPGIPPEMQYSYVIAYGDPLAFILSPLQTPALVTFRLGLFDTVAHAHSFMQETTEAVQASLTDLEGWTGLDVESVTIQEIEPLTTIGEEASFIRARVYARPAGSTEMFLPIAMDTFMIRRDRVVGQVFLMWTWGPPGPNFIPENLAKKMDAGIQEALPELLAAVQ
jgi:hypothetical protein